MLLDGIKMLDEAGIKMLMNGFMETLFMIGFSAFFSYVIGLPLGILLFTVNKDGIMENKGLYRILDVIVNIVRSIPFLILLLLVMPITKMIVGKTYGVGGTVVPLIVAAAPFIARMVEASLNEVPKGVIEAAMSMGLSNFQIITKVMLVEARSSLLVGVTIAMATILGYSAMAGAVGGGGLGDIAIQYGYYRGEALIMYICIIILIVMVQILQGLGMLIAKMLDKR